MISQANQVPGSKEISLGNQAIQTHHSDCGVNKLLVFWDSLFVFQKKESKRHKALQSMSYRIGTYQQEGLPCRMQEQISPCGISRCDRAEENHTRQG